MAETSKRIRVLVIDDSPSAFMAVRKALEPETFQVERLGCFIDLPNKVKSDPPDIILLDLNIPEFPGVAMGKYIRKHQQRRIPIVIYSSVSIPELESAATMLDADGIIRKDSNLNEVRRRVRRALLLGA